MKRPSEKAMNVAEDLLDYVHPGMNRAAAIHEIASMVDDMNAELVETIQVLIEHAERAGPGPHAVLIAHLRQMIVSYAPWRLQVEGQHDLFATSTSPGPNKGGAVAGQMP